MTAERRLFCALFFITPVVFFTACTLSPRAGDMQETAEKEPVLLTMTERAPLPEPEGDPGLFYYRNVLFREVVVAFYTEETGREDITLSVLRWADTHDIPLSLAFALCWVESRYDPLAVNMNTSSIDRGLFQLNSRSFPHLEESDFYSIETNSRHGLEYLRYCLKAGENEIVALAMYNAGRHRVTSRGAPVSTLTYISRIVDYRDELDQRLTRGLQEEAPRLAEAVQHRLKAVE